MKFWRNKWNQDGIKLPEIRFSSLPVATADIKSHVVSEFPFGFNYKQYHVYLDN